MKIKRIKIKLISLSMALLNMVTLSACNNEKTYRWKPSVCSPNYYPVMVIRGALSFPKEGGAGIMYNSFTKQKDWGELSGAGYSLGPDEKPVPDGLGIKWYSYIENKFYFGFFDLPRDTIQALFEEGIMSSFTKEKTTYNHILVGMAPGGYVFVWLHGDGTVTEVGMYKADEIEMDIKDAVTTDYYDKWTDQKEALVEFRKRRLYSDNNLEYTKYIDDPIPVDVWDKLYREKFPFKVRYNSADPDCIVDLMTMKFVNGEAETLAREPLRTNEFKKRARIKHLYFMWSSGRTIKHSYIDLDVDEILEAYGKITEGESPDRQYELRVDINKENNFIRLFLEAVGTEYPKEIELTRANIRVHPYDEHYRSRFDVFKDEYEDYDSFLRKDRDKSKDND